MLKLRLHQLFYLAFSYIFKVNERGTKAATNGASKFEWNFIPVTTSLPIQFIADHPFLFAILCDDTLLFLGRFRG
uniref:Serpin domain-containing protein n=1 Tax=Parascaris equorum TaxID=6256 RepID=A0A914RNZ1_PAREQ